MGGMSDKVILKVHTYGVLDETETIYVKQPVRATLIQGQGHTF